MPVPPCHRGPSLTRGSLLVAPTSCFIPCSGEWLRTESPPGLSLRRLLCPGGAREGLSPLSRPEGHGVPRDDGELCVLCRLSSQAVY